MLYQNISTVNIYQNYGYQFADNLFVFGNKIYKLDNSEFEDYPAILNNLYLSKKEKLQIFSNNRLIPIYFESENPKQIMLEFFTEIILFYNDSSVLMAIGVCLGVLFYDLFIRHAQGFPYIVLFGEPTSGKTTLLYCLAAVYGFTNHTELTSGTSTIAIIREGLSKLNNIPLFIDEFDKDKFEKLESLGKDTFSATPRKKCAKDGSEKITEINTTFCITTNHFFENMTFANFSRSILVDIPKGKFDLSSFKYHSKNELEKLSAFLPLILSYREKILARYREQYSIAQKYCSYSRLCNNAAIGMTMWNVINEILGTELVNTDKLAKEYFEYFERYLNTELQYGDVFLSNVYRLFVKQELMYGRDFVITKGKFLRINLKKYCDIFNSLNDKQKLNTAQLKLRLANDRRFNLKSSDLKPIGKAIKVDISENETLLDIQTRIAMQINEEIEDD